MAKETILRAAGTCACKLARRIRPAYYFDGALTHQATGWSSGIEANVVPVDDLAYYLDTVHWLDALTPPGTRPGAARRQG